MGVFGGSGIAGLNVEVEGTRVLLAWRAREAAVGLVGEDAPARKRGAEGTRASLFGLGDWAVRRDFRRGIWVSWHGHDGSIKERRTVPGVLGAWMREGTLFPGKGGGFF